MRTDHRAVQQTGTRPLISNKPLQSQTKSTSIKPWTDSVQYNKLVKVKYELFIITVEHKSSAARACFPLSTVLHVDSEAVLGMTWWTRQASRKGAVRSCWDLSDELGCHEYSMGTSKLREMTHTRGLACKHIQEASPLQVRWNMFIMTAGTSYNCSIIHY